MALRRGGGWGEAVSATPAGAHALCAARLCGGAGRGAARRDSRLLLLEDLRVVGLVHVLAELLAHLVLQRGLVALLRGGRRGRRRARGRVRRRRRGANARCCAGPRARGARAHPPPDVLSQDEQVLEQLGGGGGRGVERGGGAGAATGARGAARAAASRAPPLWARARARVGPHTFFTDASLKTLSRVAIAAPVRRQSSDVAPGRADP